MVTEESAMKRWTLVVAVVVAAVAGVLGSCTGEEERQDWRVERALTLQVDQDLFVPTSTLRIVLVGTDRMEATEADLVLRGEVQGREVEERFSVTTEREGDVGNLYVSVSASGELWPRLQPGSQGGFLGDVEIELQDTLGIAGRGRLDRVTWRFMEELVPTLEGAVPAAVFPNSVIHLDGEGVLRPEEGQTWAVIESGHLEADRGHRIELDGQRLPVGWDGSRERGALRMDPAVVGVHPGDVEVAVRFENEYSDGTILAGHGGGLLQTRMEPTFVASLSPDGVSRGQLVEVRGRGFVSDRETAGVGMILRFDGVLTPDDSSLGPIDLTGDTAIERNPYRVRSDELIEQNIWYNVEGRSLTGLGAVPGRFEGTITPVVFDSYGEVVGVEWAGEFRILPTKQVVYVKYLPAFTVALNRYGLVNVEREIRNRILEVLRRDYDGLNMRFVEEPPSDFVDYTTVEIGGPDPASGYAFGYDNTYNDQPKDTGNLYIDNYLGGLNWQAGEEWNNPYGGIFVESFALFSPTLFPDNPHGSEHFDRIFGPFMPELGGQPVRATEWPDGDRSDRIAEAVRVFGNVVGNTTGHEVGHALGLAHFPEDWDSPGHFYHNPTASGCIMDSGADRSFEQRAEIEGQGPAVFNERNRTYLETILPRP